MLRFELEFANSIETRKNIFNIEVKSKYLEPASEIYIYFPKPHGRKKGKVFNGRDELGNRKLFGPSIIEEYDTTIYAEEALHRLVEVHYVIGLKDEAKKYAKLLGYNYESSQWYEQSYNIFNRKYKKNLLL